MQCVAWGLDLVIYIAFSFATNLLENHWHVWGTVVEDGPMYLVTYMACSKTTTLPVRLISTTCSSFNNERIIICIWWHTLHATECFVNTKNSRRWQVRETAHSARTWQEWTTCLQDLKYTPAVWLVQSRGASSNQDAPRWQRWCSSELLLHALLTVWFDLAQHTTRESVVCYTSEEVWILQPAPNASQSSWKDYILA